MTGATPSTDRDRGRAAFARCLSAAVAATDPSRLLTALAEGWRTVTGAEAVVVGWRTGDGRRAVVARSSMAEPPAFLSVDDLAADAWNEASLSVFLSRFDVRDPAGAACPSENVALRDASASIRGGVLCVPASDATLDPCWFDELTRLSVGTLERLLPGDSANVPIEFSRLEALAEFAAGAGHEINNPLATISGRVQLLLRDEADPERRQSLTTIGAQALRIRDMIGDLMLFGRPPAPRLVDCDLSQAVRDVVDRLDEPIRHRRAHVELDLAEPVVVRADRDQLAVAISSLLRNSLEAIGDGGRVSIVTERVVETDRTWGRLVVADDGQGLSDVDRRHLFDPFYSGRQAGRGLGFGLPKVWRIVTNHGGTIDVIAPSTGGTTFEAFWPSAGNVEFSGT